MASLKYTTYASGTVGSNYTAGDSTLTLATGHGARFPAAGDFWVRLGNANGTIRKVTARTGDVLTFHVPSPYAVADGTIDQDAAAGLTVDWVMGTAALDQLRADLCQSGTFAGKPASEKAGILYLPTDAGVILRDSGAALLRYGPILPLTDCPAAATFTAVNTVAGSTLTDSQSGLQCWSDAAGTESWRMWLNALPATPYTITMLAQVSLPLDAAGKFGFVWRDSGSGKLVGFQVASQLATSGGTYFVFAKYSSPTTYTGNYRAEFRTFSALVALRIVDTGSVFRAYLSPSGSDDDWIQFDQDRSRTDYLATPNQVGIMIESLSSTVRSYANILSYKVS